MHFKCHFHAIALINSLRGVEKSLRDAHRVSGLNYEIIPIPDSMKEMCRKTKGKLVEASIPCICYLISDNDFSLYKSFEETGSSIMPDSIEIYEVLPSGEIARIYRFGKLWKRSKDLDHSWESDIPSDREKYCNYSFLPGDAFFHARVSIGDVTKIESEGTVVLSDYFGPLSEANCMELRSVSLGKVPSKQLNSLANVYKCMRCDMAWAICEMDSEHPNKCYEEKNPIHVFIHSGDFNFSKYDPLLKYNEDWSINSRKVLGDRYFTGPGEYFKSGIGISWRDANNVPPLEVKAVESGSCQMFTLPASCMFVCIDDESLRKYQRLWDETGVFRDEHLGMLYVVYTDGTIRSYSFKDVLSDDIVPDNEFVQEDMARARTVFWENRDITSDVLKIVSSRWVGPK